MFPLYPTAYPGDGGMVLVDAERTKAKFLYHISSPVDTISERSVIDVSALLFLIFLISI